MNVAVLGLGFMGSTHVKAWQSVPGARIAAVMSSDPAKLDGDLTAITGNLGIQGDRFDFSDVRKYRTIKDVLADTEIDVIDVCLPTALHSSTAIDALRAGKNVFVEKPIALNGNAADEVCRAARESGRILMAGQVLRFIPSYVAAAAWIKQSGAIDSAVFRRRCAAPAWSRWLSDKTQSGGGVFDLLIHDVDFCISLWGMPEKVRATGAERLSAGVDVIHADLHYPGIGSVIIAGGWHHPKSYPFSMDFTIVSNSGTIEWSSANQNGLRLYSAEGNESEIPALDTDPFAAELNYFAACVRDNRPTDACPPEQSAQAVKLMQFMLESRERNGEIVKTS